MLGYMKHLGISRVCTARITTLQASPPGAPAPEGSAARAHQLIEQLHLSVLPRESGYLGLIGQSAQTVLLHGRALAVQSQAYYMLTLDRPINYPHSLHPHDPHILIASLPSAYC